jgi:hypothetical protein
VVVCTHTKVNQLVDMIIQKTDIASYKINIFREISIDSLMDEDETLESFGLKSGPYNKVSSSHSKTVLYYDYEMMEKTDAVLASDFYFHKYEYKKT